MAGESNGNEAGYVKFRGFKVIYIYLAINKYTKKRTKYHFSFHYQNTYVFSLSIKSVVS